MLPELRSDDNEELIAFELRSLPRSTPRRSARWCISLAARRPWDLAARLEISRHTTVIRTARAGHTSTAITITSTTR
jgi:hypothetical protein